MQHLEYEKLFRRKSIKDFYGNIPEFQWELMTQRILEIGIAYLERNFNSTKLKFTIENLQDVLSKLKSLTLKFIQT